MNQLRIKFKKIVPKDTLESSGTLTGCWTWIKICFVLSYLAAVLKLFAFSNADLMKMILSYLSLINFISSLPSLFINKLNRKLMVLKRSEPKKAGQKPVTAKPLTILEVM